MPKRNSYAQWANDLSAMVHRIPLVEHQILDLWAKETQKEAKDVIIGRTSPLEATGEFPAWEPLLDATIEAKAKKGLGLGGDPNSMLYASGALHDSIEETVEGKTGYVGTDVPYAAVHEYGSVHVPPRPFLGPSSVRVMVRLYTRFHKMFQRTLEGKK